MKDGKFLFFLNINKINEMQIYQLYNLRVDLEKKY